MPSGSLPKRTLFPVRSARLHQKVLFPLGQGAATTFYAKRDAHHIRCSAVALSGNSVCQAANDDDSPSTATATAGASSTGAQQQAIVHRADSDTAAASASAEGEERTVVGEIVLSDWLEELPLASLTLPGAGQRSREGKHDDQQGRVEVVSNQQHGQRGGRGEEQGEEDISAPFRFQQVIQVTIFVLGVVFLREVLAGAILLYLEWSVGIVQLRVFCCCPVTCHMLTYSVRHGLQS